MTETTTRGKNITYHPFKTDDKHYFGGFFNLADNNIEEAFAEVAQRLHHKNKSPQDLIKHYTESRISLTDYERFVKMLSNYFPIVKEIDQTHDKGGNAKTKQQRISDFKTIVELLIETVERLRNYYTHYHHEAIKIDNSLFDFLDSMLVKTVIKIKNNYLKDDKTREVISASLKEELDMLYHLKIKNLEDTKKQDPTFKFSKDRTQIDNSIYNDAVNDFIYYKDRNAYLAEMKKTASDTEKSKLREGDFQLPISSSGIVFLLSLFLNRKDIEDLKANIKGYKGKVNKTEAPTLKKNGIRFMTTHRIYSYWHYKGLKNKIRTSESNTKETLLMQMIDELSKVPDVLYKNLSKDLQKLFIVDWNTYFKDNEENNASLATSEVVHPVIRKRYEDKFNYFAIRFLDEYVHFPSLRFQIYLGNYVVDSRPKEIAKVITEREIKKKIFVFGKLSKVNTLKREFISKIEDNETATQWEIFPNPSYHFPMENSEDLKHANKIGIVLNGIHGKIETYKTEQHKHSSAKKRNIIKEITQNNKDIHIGQAVAYLSMNDIHSIIYEALKTEDRKEDKIDGTAIEVKIRTKINTQIEEILNKNADAKIIKNYLKKSTTPIDLTKLHKDLDHEIAITETRLNALEENIKEYENYKKYLEARKKNRNNHKYKDTKRKYILYNAEKGNIATWLANDIKRFFPKAFKDNWKGHQHSAFQLYIAYYDTEAQRVKSLLHGVNYRKEIPMIDFSKPNFVYFYSEYLKRRKKQFSDLKNHLKRFTTKDHGAIEALFGTKLRMFKKKNYQNKSLDQKLNTTLANPIFIARGFMDTKPTVIPKTSFKGNEDKFADWFVAFKQFSDYQSFYNTSKYPLNITQKDTRDVRKLNTKLYKQKRNDWTVWTMAQYLFKTIFEQELNHTLTDVYHSEKDQAEETQKFIWDQTVELPLNGTITIPNVKLKDIGNYRKYETDQRIATFLSYNDITDWMAYLPNDWAKDAPEKPINVIQIQLDAYEKIRQHQLLKEVQALEAYIFSKATDKAALRQGGNPNFRQYIVNGLLQQIKGIAVADYNIPNTASAFDALTQTALNNMSEVEQQATILIVIRNKFAHNQLPNKAVYAFSQHILKRDAQQTYAAYYLALFNHLKKAVIHHG